ncbi:unnamed protein product [Prorocentrum cordatum]|uniref:Protein xylosyltransferase n=1 Tax=Prorocentrum cordatum TaxID=2364126 RepID=A0ABN9T8I8_9DINO|nr:unnamed protein product [Polarella glacialis]
MGGKKGQRFGWSTCGWDWDDKLKARQNRCGRCGSEEPAHDELVKKASSAWKDASYRHEQAVNQVLVCEERLAAAREKEATAALALARAEQQRRDAAAAFSKQVGGEDKEAACTLSWDPALFENLDGLDGIEYTEKADLARVLGELNSYKNQFAERGDEIKARLDSARRIHEVSSAAAAEISAKKFEEKRAQRVMQEAARRSPAHQETAVEHRDLFCGSIMQWGPTALKWIEGSLLRRDFHGYLIQETHLDMGSITDVERHLSALGLETCFSAALSSRNSTRGFDEGDPFAHLDLDPDIAAAGEHLPPELETTDRAADNLGHAYAAFVHTMEAFFCGAYGISEDDRQKFLGRGKGYEYNWTSSATCGHRRPRYANQYADWWSSTATALGRHESARAALHGQLWKDRLLDITVLDHDILKGMAAQATQEKQWILRRDIRASNHDYAQWVCDMAKTSPGTIHRITKEQPRFEDELIDAHGTKHFAATEKIDAKAAQFTQLIFIELSEHHLIMANRCLTTPLDLEGHDPAISMPTSQVRAWFDMRAKNPELNSWTDADGSTWEFTADEQAGPRQSNNRADNSVKSTNGDLHFWTDSAALVAGWRNLRHQGPFNQGPNADIWQLIHKALIGRHGTISLFKIESHLTLEEHAWAGNNIADQLADQAAAEQAIGAAQLDLYDWIRATAVKVRDRICQATRDAFECRPPQHATRRQQRADELNDHLPETPLNLSQTALEHHHDISKGATLARWDCTRGQSQLCCVTRRSLDVVRKARPGSAFAFYGYHLCFTKGQRDIYTCCYWNSRSSLVGKAGPGCAFAFDGYHLYFTMCECLPQEVRAGMYDFYFDWVFSVGNEARCDKSGDGPSGWSVLDEAWRGLGPRGWGVDRDALLECLATGLRGSKLSPVSQEMWAERLAAAAPDKPRLVRLCLSATQWRARETAVSLARANYDGTSAFASTKRPQLQAPAWATLAEADQPFAISAINYTRMSMECADGWAHGHIAQGAPMGFALCSRRLNNGQNLHVEKWREQDKYIHPDQQLRVATNPISLEARDESINAFTDDITKTHAVRQNVGDALITDQLYARTTGLEGVFGGSSRQRGGGGGDEAGEGGRESATAAALQRGRLLGAHPQRALGGQSRAAGCVLVVVQPCGRLGNLLFQLAAALSAARAAAGALCVAVADDGLARRYADTVLRAVGGLLVAPGLLQQEGRAANATREACGLSEVAVPKGRFLAGGVSSCIAWKAFSRWCGRSGARCQRMDAGAPDGGGDWAEPLAEALLGYRRRGGGVEPCSMVWLSGYFQDLRYFGAHLAWLRGLFWHAPSAQRAEGMLASVAPPGRGVAAAIHYRFGDLWHWFPGDVLYDGYQGWASSLAKERVNRELTCLVFSDAPSTARRSIEVLDGCSEVKMMMDVGDVLRWWRT